MTRPGVYHVGHSGKVPAGCAKGLLAFGLRSQIDSGWRAATPREDAGNQKRGDAWQADSRQRFASLQAAGPGIVRRSQDPAES